MLSFLYGPTLTSVHDYWKDHGSCFCWHLLSSTTLPSPHVWFQCLCSRGVHMCSALQSCWATSLCLNRVTSRLCRHRPLSLEDLSLLLAANSRPISKAHLTHREWLFLSATCARLLCRWKWRLPLLGVRSSAFPWQTYKQSDKNHKSTTNYASVLHCQPCFPWFWGSTMELTFKSPSPTHWMGKPSQHFLNQWPCSQNCTPLSIHLKTKVTRMV